MKLRLRPMTPLVLRGVIKRLRQVESMPEPALNFDQLRPAIRAIVEKMAPETADGLVIAAVDAHIASCIHEFWRAAQQHHNLTIAQLDELMVQMRSYLREVDGLNEDVYSQFTHINGAVTHALDRVSDPDTPFYDPIPSQHPERQP
jgi:hypothetical protein